MWKRKGLNRDWEKYEVGAIDKLNPIFGKMSPLLDKGELTAFKGCSRHCTARLPPKSPLPYMHCTLILFSALHSNPSSGSHWALDAEASKHCTVQAVTKLSPLWASQFHNGHEPRRAHVFIVTSLSRSDHSQLTRHKIWKIGSNFMTLCESMSNIQIETAVCRMMLIFKQLNIFYSVFSGNIRAPERREYLFAISLRAIK